MAKTPNKNNEKAQVRQPVVAVMGHVDHGKSTLLDYIRKSNVVASETGGITQHISAYEVEHMHEGAQKRITFLDTPGHAAFTAIRERGSRAADIAVLVVAADDGVKAQTLEALEAIKEADIPFVVAINKIDKPEANVDRAKQSLLEHGIYLEGLGGDISWTAVSAKTGSGIEELLDLILLVAELGEFSADPTLPGEGVILETKLDSKRGIAATLIVQNGCILSGTFVVSGSALAPVRIMEDFTGKQIREARPGMPVQITGWSEAPEVGERFQSVPKKKDAEKLAAAARLEEDAATPEREEHAAGDVHVTVPIVLKADTRGSLDAIRKEIESLKTERLTPKIIQEGAGTLTESDVKTASGIPETIILGFNVAIDAPARELAERSAVTLHSFDIIYELTDWLKEEMERRTPKTKEKEARGRANVLKVFSSTKDVWLIGGRLKEGTLSVGDRFTLVRRTNPIGEGTVKTLQQNRTDQRSIDSGEFGAQVSSKNDIAEGDVIESFVVVEK